ncbi:DUF2849 domain-containing protein [uncultured Albimonas sp.]|uniref:DUF2849 domain-containing protein n=1 Tax=uncultured Albimonas sp. TaxID=1331701 RepID=UPI0030ECEBE6
MAKTFKPVVLTANALEGGEAVWWTGAGWSPRFAEACPARSAEDARMLETLGLAPFFESLVVGPYLAEVELTEQGLAPGSRREAIRADAAPTFDYLVGAGARERAA